jgi:hypothetical protein
MNLESQVALPLSLIVCSSLFSGPAFAQAPAPVTEAEIRAAIQTVDELARRLEGGVSSYQEHLKAALKAYGPSYDDPVLGRKLESFAADIQTGDPDQTARAKLALFACLIRTAGVRLDPDLIREWNDIQSLLDRFETRIDEGGAVWARSNLYVAGAQNIPVNVLRKLKGEWQSALARAQQQRTRALSARPQTLAVGQAFMVRSVEGASFRANFFGLEIGREMGNNVVALSQLTYLGKAAHGDAFLLTTLTSRRGKTRVDTTVQPRAVLVYSDSRDAVRYGHAVSTHEYPGYTVLGARVADVAGSVQDWIWKTLPRPGAGLPPAAALEGAPDRIRRSERGLEEAVARFQRLAAESTRANDSARILEAKRLKARLRLPEQDLRELFPESRAFLYAGRALAAEDPRFLEARERINQAQREVEADIAREAAPFLAFNGVQVEAAPAVPWKSVDQLATEFMRSAAHARETVRKSRLALPHTPTGDPSVILPSRTFPRVQVSQLSGGAEDAYGDRSVLIIEHIVRDVHWSIKGLPRRESTTEYIETWPEGDHRVQRISGPSYSQ